METPVTMGQRVAVSRQGPGMLCFCFFNTMRASLNKWDQRGCCVLCSGPPT